MKRIYLDYAASTPVDARVEAAMKPYFSKIYGNPGALHWFGQEASAAVFKARDVIAKSLGADYREIVFTGSATEANNLALRGAVKALSVERLASRKLIANCYKPKARIIVSAIEHESVLDTARDLEREGVEVVYIPVSREGIADLKKLEAALDDRTVLVSVMYANNEVGAIQPITEIAKIIRNFRESRIMRHESRDKIHNSLFMLHDSYPIFHVDAVQAFQYLNCDVNDLGVDMMTLSAHKIYGPKGIGALYIRSTKHEARNSKQIQNSNAQNSKPVSDFGFRISDLPVISGLITGGGQERGLRSGTENVPYIAAFAEAVKIAAKMKEKESKRVSQLRDYFWRAIKRIMPKASLNGSAKERLPNNLNVYFPGHNAGDLLIKLDLAGVAASPGAACSARAAKPSYVLEALGFSHARCTQSLRFSLGRQTTKWEINAALDKMAKIML